MSALFTVHADEAYYPKPAFLELGVTFDSLGPAVRYAEAYIQDGTHCHDYVYIVRRQANMKPRVVKAWTWTADGCEPTHIVRTHTGYYDMGSPS